MLPWIQVYSNLPEHPKIYALVDRLNLRRNYEAVGIVVSLWLWAAKNAPDGDLSGFPDRAIAAALGYSRGSSATKICEVLRDTGWLDAGENGGYSIHKWDEYAALLIAITKKQKRKGRERVERYRTKLYKAQEEKNPQSVENRGNSDSTDSKCNAEKTAAHAKCNALTGPDQTGPNLTGISSSSDPAENSSSSSWSEEQLASIFSPRLTLSETALGELTALSQGMEEGLLIRAMDIAQDNGSPVWSYVRGILQNWQKRGIRTVAAAEQRERQRTKGRAAQPEPAAVPAVAASDVAKSRRGMERLREELNR